MNKYDDIINLPHHVSTKRPQMSLENRSAQFAPFAALTGHSEAIKETARLTDKKIDIDETRKLMLDYKLQTLHRKIKDRPEIMITYFVLDEKKNGGCYQISYGVIKKIDLYKQCVILEDNTKILFSDIYDIDGNIFCDVQ